jgi:hypothetical protein
VDTVDAHGSSATSQQAQHAQRTRHAPTRDGGDRPPARTPAWDVVTVPSRHGLEAVDILRLRTGLGPVLHDRSGDTLGFLVPPGTSLGWDLPGSACTETCDPARRQPAEPPVAGAGWLLPPEHAAPVTDPTLLRLALGEAARTIEAAGHRPR